MKIKDAIKQANSDYKEWLVDDALNELAEAKMFYKQSFRDFLYASKLMIFNSMMICSPPFLYLIGIFVRIVKK